MDISFDGSLEMNNTIRHYPTLILAGQTISAANRGRPRLHQIEFGVGGQFLGEKYTPQANK